ncbi:UPF0481 protein [Prunus yedoensis var. nudiflora]|uniref:UPF0481 protein n=1 Tax=Prunus yedoensis var. nudiflora TaxID=2094558 RepID=A0A314YG28_PRUYE|nr:UPF0481 protein [Prunus yedoensis var. nudiflora]
MAANNATNENELLASSIRGKLHRQSPLRAHHSVFRIPNVLLNGNEKIYVPKLLSIGPFHRGLSLETMEGVKLRYLHCLLERNPTPNTGLVYFVEAIRGMEQDCRNCYEEHIDMLSDEFVEMLVVDGCFIIELFRKFSAQVPIEVDDPVIHKSWMRTTLINDLLLLENQLPWMVVECLFNLTQDTTAGNNYPLPLPLLELTLRYFKESTLGMYPKVNGTFGNKHLLDFIKNSLLGSYAEKNEFEPSIWSPIPSATNLKKAGVIFRCGKKDDMLNIIYENNVMKIPPIRIHVNGESLFRNIIAYEQCEPIGISKFTSYAVVLENLIKCEDDVEFLTERGIIVNFSGCDIPLLMSNLASDVRVYNFSYEKLYKEVNAYYRHPLTRLIAPYRRLVEDPLAFANFTYAVILVTALTFVQTVISVLTYDKSR